MGFAELIAGIKIATQVGPDAVALIRGLLDGKEPTLEEIASKEARFAELKPKRDQIIADAERRLANQ